MTTLSQQYDIKFSYIEDEIIIYNIPSPEKLGSLEQKIAFIQKKTNLKFQLIDKKYYSIFNDKKIDKPLCGFLLDADTGIGIENAMVSITGNTISTFTNNEGYFELPRISPNTIQINHQGYEKTELNPEELNVTSCPKFKLKPIIQQLSEVIAPHYLTTGVYKKNDGSIEIRPMKFGILPGLTEPDVLQTMQQIPGINSIDETVSNINVRGGTHDQNLFLWNGIRMFQTGHFFGLISAFNTSLSQSISITKNGSSAFYGEGVSSLIDISSHPKTIEENKNSVSSNLISAEFYSKLKLSDNSNVTVSARRSLTDFFSSQTYKNYSHRIFQNTVITDLNNNENVDYKSDVYFYFYDVTGQLQQKIGKKNELNIDFIAIENNLHFNQSTDIASKSSKLEQENFGSSINWKTHWNKNNSTDFAGYVSSYNLSSTYENIESGQISSQQNTVFDIGLRISHSNIISNRVVFNSGYQFNDIKVENIDAINLPIYSRYIKKVLLTHVGVLEGIYETENKKTFLKAGLRANYFDSFNTFVLEPRIQFNQALNNHIRLEILGEQKSQTLSQVTDLQDDFLGIEKRRWTLANNNSIPIQKSKQLSVGLTYKDNNWLITLDNFTKKVTGITSKTQGFQNQFINVNSIGAYEVIGSEFLIQKNFGRFYSWLSYTFNDNTYEFKAISSDEFINNFEIKSYFSWAGIYEWKKLKIALGTKWHSGKPITTPQSFTIDPNNPEIVYNSPNNGHLKDFFQVNFSASKEWKLKDKMNLQTSFSILNLFNTKNKINRYYKIDATNTSVVSVTTYALQFTPNMNVKLNF